MDENTTQLEVAEDLEKRFNYGLRRLSDRIAYARIKANLTHEDVANDRGVTLRTAMRWETRQGAPHRPRILIPLAKLFNISYPFLMSHFGSQYHDFDQGIELEYLQQKWSSLDRDKQIATFNYVQTLLDDK
jgi:transcriptional regulator with XRE-family HTH domain